MLLDELKTRLTSTGVALAKLPGSTSTLSYTLYEGFIPPEPDQVVVLTETPGLAPYGRFGLSQPAFQVRVRGVSFNTDATAYTNTRDRIEQIRTELHAMVPATITGISGIWAEQEPYPLGIDVNNRWEFVCNFRCLRDST